MSAGALVGLQSGFSPIKHREYLCILRDAAVQHKTPFYMSVCLVNVMAP